MKIHSHHFRRGFTLIELLVVIAIIGVLMALLLPAIQKVREAANDSKCRANLNQIAMAFHMVHEEYGMFPKGGQWCCPTRASQSGGTPRGPMRQRMGWAYQILPYLEQRNSWKQWWRARFDVIPVYFCPSRRAPTKYPPWGTGLLDYAAAHVPEHSWQTSAHLNHSHSSREGGIVIRSTRFTWGGGWNDIKIQLTEGAMPDGSSNTIMVSEKWLSSNEYFTGTGSDDYGHTDGWDQDTIRLATRRPIPDDPSNSWSNWHKSNSFGSAHVAGINAVFADRAVRKIKYGVNRIIFYRAWNRKDRVPFNLEDL